MRTRRIHLVNPRADSFTTRPMYFNRALYSPLAGLLAVAALIPEDRYEVVLTDENIEEIDFDLAVDLVGISAMTSYVKRGYEIADAFRNRGVPVIMGGVHPSFMPEEALQHADAVVIGEAELVMSAVLEDLERGSLQDRYQADRLHPMLDMPLPRYDLIKANRYVNKTFIQTSRGCHHGCTFCAEHLMNGLPFRYRPVDEVLREIDHCGKRTIAFNDADFFGTKERPAELMRALKGRNIRWQAGVNTNMALDDELLELAAESGCFMLSIGFESISRQTLKNVHKYQNNPETYQALVEKIHSHGILVFGLFMFGFGQDDDAIFQETSRFNVEADYDVCAYSLLTPYPGTVSWYEMLQNDQIVSFDWDRYDQGHIVYRPEQLTPEQLQLGLRDAYQRFYSPASLLRRFPVRGSRSRLYWTIYNLFFRKGEVTGAYDDQVVAEPTPAPAHSPSPPIMPRKQDWQRMMLDNAPGKSGEPVDDSPAVEEALSVGRRTP